MPIPGCASDLQNLPLDAVGTARSDDSVLSEWLLYPSPGAALMCGLDQDGTGLAPAPTGALLPAATQAALALPETQQSLPLRGTRSLLKSKKRDPKEKNRLAQQAFRRRKKDQLQALAQENQRLKLQIVQGASDRERALHAANHLLQEDLMALKEQVTVARSEIRQFEGLFQEWMFTPSTAAEVPVRCRPSRPVSTLHLRCRTSQEH